MFDLGLTLRFEDFGKVFKHPWPIAVALLGQLVLLPLIALGLAWAFNLTPVFFIGLILIACCPGGSSSNVFSRLAGGDVALSVILTALSSVITLFTIPVIMSWATRMIGESVGITLPVGNLIKQNLLLMLLPVLLGIGIHYIWPKAAAGTDKVLSKLAFPLLMVLITVFYIQHHETILKNIGQLGLCVTVLILLAITCSSVLSRLVRNSSQQRRTVVIEVGMQNAAQAIAIASSPFIFHNEVMAIPAILYSLMMNIVLLIYVGIVRKKNQPES
jgi:BASS family bile acid:Na+ symporter